MRALSSRISRTLVPMSTMTCADNSGAMIFKIINKLGKGHAHGRLAAAGLGDIVIASVIKGTPTYLKKPVRVVIVRQKAPIRRGNGMRLRFEDNAGIMIGDDNLPIGTEVKGAIAREVVERFVKVAGIASRIV
ncbi:MAG: uL14 family ribosomal protein [Candidatus Micrarchaeota archaeon]|nr:uL14 family ribosomal protein [Candidatus Micrarchaeota archaeon]